MSSLQIQGTIHLLLEEYFYSYIIFLNPCSGLALFHQAFPITLITSVPSFASLFQICKWFKTKTLQNKQKTKPQGNQHLLNHNCCSHGYK